ncbi:MAG TPA: flagellar basal body L-ring protein FlgH [Phenylobacterium sp.]
MRTRLPVLALILLAPLAACSTVKEAVRGPELAPVGYPAALAPMEQRIIARDAPQPASANSLWRVGARTFFNDQRANKVGDILTVQIDIDDSAKTTNTSSSSRTSGVKAGLPHLLGLESSIGKILPGAFDPANALETSSATTNAGAGSVNRQEKISLTIAAVVSGVLPNGNLVIQGTQEVRTNAEVRQLTVAGIVRPEDISSANTIKHTQIAEARISYGGRGDISRVQKTPAGQSLIERFSPF